MANLFHLQLFHGSQPVFTPAQVRRLVADFVNGNNACVLAYGQTGSGKTHTMFGPDAKTGSAVVCPDVDKSGIVPRACSEVMRVVKQRSDHGIEVNLRVSYVEVYGDSVTDLLNDGAGVGMWQVGRFICIRGFMRKYCWWL